MTLKERIANNLCCFCEAPLNGDGRNPDPACTVDGARCCPICDWNIVNPVREIIPQIIEEGLKPEEREGTKAFLNWLDEEAMKKLPDFLKEHPECTSQFEEFMKRMNQKYNQ